MISGPLTLPPLAVMKMSPLVLLAPCFSTMTAGALAWAEAPELTALRAVPVKAITAATAAAPACGALPRHEPAARHETALSPIAQLRPSGSHYHVRPLPLPALTYPCCLLPPVFLAGAKSQVGGCRV